MSEENDEKEIRDGLIELYLAIKVRTKEEVSALFSYCADRQVRLGPTRAGIGAAERC